MIDNRWSMLISPGLRHPKTETYGSGIGSAFTVPSRKHFLIIIINTDDHELTVPHFSFFFHETGVSLNVYRSPPKLPGPRSQLRAELKETELSHPCC